MNPSKNSLLRKLIILPEQISYPNAVASRLGRIGWADALFRRAQRLLALLQLLQAIHLLHTHTKRKTRKRVICTPRGRHPLPNTLCPTRNPPGGSQTRGALGPKSPADPASPLTLSPRSSPTLRTAREDGSLRHYLETKHFYWQILQIIKLPQESSNTEVLGQGSPPVDRRSLT